ncbi:MAG: hypothetical protein WBV92_01315 [Nitrosotalea sp.]
MNHSKIFLVTILSITTVLLLTSSSFAPLASAQYQGQGGQGYQGQGGQGYQGQGYPGQGFRGPGQGFHGVRTAVNGTYANSNFGIQITLPDGWSGFEVKQSSGNARVMIAPGGIQTTQGASRPPVIIGISMMPSTSTMPTSFMPRNMQGFTCTNATSTNSVNSLNLNVVTIDCTGTDSDGNPVEMKSKIETAQTNSTNIILSIRANPSSGYDSQVSTFDNMVSTLQVSTPSLPLPTPQDQQQPQPPSQSMPQITGKIPNWVKGVFGMYAQGKLSDADLIQALQFLIKQGILNVS